MCRPPEPLSVRNIVRPVTAKIKENIARNERPPVQFHPPGNQIVEPHKNRKDKKLERSADGHIADTHPYRAKGLLLFIILSVLEIRDCILDQYEEKHRRRGPNNNIRSIALYFVYVAPHYLFGAEEIRKIHVYDLRFGLSNDPIALPQKKRRIVLRVTK